MAKQLSVAVRLPAAPRLHRGCVDALRELDGIRVLPLATACEARDLDLILDLTSRPVDPRHLTAARLGYWTFLYGETPERTAPAVPDFLAGRRAAFVRLARLLPGARAVILREGSVKTVAHSLAGTRERLLDAASHWPAQALAGLARRGGAPQGLEVTLPVRSRAARMARRMRLPVALIRNIARRVGQQLTREHWRIGVIEQPIASLVKGFDPAAIRWLEVPFAGFVADPFARAGTGGDLTILAEAFPWKARRGQIAAITRRRDGAVTMAPTSLAFATHLSYPYLIEHQGEIYCLPESSAQGRVQLFRALEFPGRWVPDQVLLEDFPGADATVIRHHDGWWMFACSHADQDEAKLFIFHSRSLKGPWIAHALNPVKCDLRSSRPAGTPFLGEDGMLYRPAQDCSRVYGGAVVINRVTRLSLTEFEEEVAARLAPDPAGPCPDGLHTLSAAGDVTLVDGKRHGGVPAPLAAALNRLRGSRARNTIEHDPDRFCQPAT